MIEISVTMFPLDNGADMPESYLDYAKFLNQEHQTISKFFQNCIDQNLILNVFYSVQDVKQDTTTYYATTVEKAQAFEQMFQDVSAEFSMRKFWNQSGFETSVTMQEIDFENTHLDFGELVNEKFSEIWGIEFPVET
jgi:hypothetical protein